MSDRIKGFTVALEKDLHEDDAKAIQSAILCLRGVANVQPSLADSTYPHMLYRYFLIAAVAYGLIAMVLDTVFSKPIGEVWFVLAVGGLAALVGIGLAVRG